MIAPGDTVLVAISAGPDSTALLHALVQLRTRRRFRVRACHVHHGQRGEEANADAAFARTLARSLRVPFSQHRADVRAFADENRVSIETAARTVRYQALERAADRAGASRIATGHTADDQAETVLMNLLRGTGPTGLAGIPSVRGRLIRPLLDVTRADVEAYCNAQHLEYRLDSSNLDRAFTRNRIRHDLLPALRVAQPRVDAILCRLADIMGAENDYMAAQTAHALREVGAQRPEEIGVACAPFALLPKALQRRVLRAAVARLKGDELDIELERVEALVALALSGRTGAIVELPGGVRAERTYGEVVFSLVAPPSPAVSREWSLPVPGEVILQELGMALTAARSRARRAPASPMSALLDAQDNALPLTVRTRRRGDRFTPFGMKGSVKLQDFFVNAKVPRALRAWVPLLLCGDTIAWIVGHRISDRFKVTARTRRTIRIEATEHFIFPSEA
ncbi:MAG: tRNA lysidine(34) synthetase TilS [Armatimonadetes bacterium]|nr:tRNA lysidine(34) synthetase TilS [Armatimonadota bacterium]